MSQPIFLSIGKTFTPQQEAFVAAVENYLRAQGLEPRTIGRNYFRNDQPLKTVTECMKECVGAMSSPLSESTSTKAQRSAAAQTPPCLPKSISPPSGTRSKRLSPTPRTALCSSLLKNGLKLEGLLQTGYDWWVQHVTLHQSSLSPPSSHRSLVTGRHAVPKHRKHPAPPHPLFPPPNFRSRSSLAASKSDSSGDCWPHSLAFWLQWGPQPTSSDRHARRRHCARTNSN